MLNQKKNQNTYKKENSYCIVYEKKTNKPQQQIKS